MTSAAGRQSTVDGPDTGPAPEQPGRVARLRARWRHQRDTRPWLDHLVHAGGVFNRRQADLLAAGITYFGFLALFPTVLLAVSVAGFVLAGRPDLLASLTDQIREAVPGDLGQTLVDSVGSATDARGIVGLIGLLGLAYAGMGWIGKLRLALQIIWRGEPDQANILSTTLRNLVGLVGLGVAVLLSVALTVAATALTGRLLDLLGLDALPGATVVTALLGIAISVAGDTLVFCWVLVYLPRAAVGYRAVLPGALFTAVGFEILKIVGVLYIARVSASPAAGIFGSALGLIVWIYLVSRFLLFAAAWTSTLPSVVAGSPAEPSAVSDLAVQGPSTPPVRVDTPSTAAVAASLVGVGAVLGVAVRPAVRWWRRRG